MKKHIILLIISVVICFANKAQALSMNEILQVMMTGYHSMNNHDENNSAISISAHEMGWGFEYLMKINSSENKNTGWVRTNATINGEPVEGKNLEIYYSTYDFDENGKLKAIYAPHYYGHNGELVQTIKYASDGQMLVYNSNGELVGAYSNWSEKMMASDGYYDRKEELNHIKDGNYIVKDNSDNIIEQYYQNGDYLKNSYNSTGILVSTNKYDKEGNIKESLSYEYDTGGNLLKAYQNGKAVYKRKIYSPAEAANAAKKEGNTLVIVW